MASVTSNQTKRNTSSLALFDIQAFYRHIIPSFSPLPDYSATEKLLTPPYCSNLGISAKCLTISSSEYEFLSIQALDQNVILHFVRLYRATVSTTFCWKITSFLMFHKLQAMAKKVDCQNFFIVMFFHLLVIHPSKCCLNVACC
uniref:Uncharacterized protein n=1 Tax=Opuntia streptacantha TaxID=393608 RepID=A0A7C8YM72_OPUST